MTIKLLYLSFELPLFSVEIPTWLEAWRLAMPEGAVHFDATYPLLQLRCKENKGAVLAINEGVESFRQGLNEIDWNLSWNGGTKKLLIDHMEFHEHQVRVLKTPQEYRLFRWVAMGEADAAHWEEKRLFVDKIAYLEELLRNQVQTVLHALDPSFEGKDLQVQLSDWRQSSRIRINGRFFDAFDLSFLSSHSLPPLIGIGHGVALGFGWMVPYMAKKMLKNVSTSV